MKIHEFGDKSNPVILLLPGTMCYWKGNFGGVIDEVSKHFLVAAVAYTGFDETDTESYISVTDELDRIEQYIKAHYHGTIRAAYGCSLGGTFWRIWLHGTTSACNTASSAVLTSIRQARSKQTS